MATGPAARAASRMKAVGPSGRCCGTAGVGDVLLDAAQDGAGQAAYGTLLHGARTMADALVERAIRDVREGFFAARTFTSI